MPSSENSSFAVVDKTVWIATLILFGFISAVVFHYTQGPYYGRGYPLSTFLVRPTEAFDDYLNLYGLAKQQVHPYLNRFEIGYGPLPMLLMQLLAKFNSRVGMWFMVITFLATSGLSMRYWTKRTLNSALAIPILVIMTLLPYPSLFALDRMNIELLSYSFSAISILLLAKGKTNWAALFLAVSGGIKIYMLCFVCLFVAQRKYRAAGLVIGSFFLLTGLSYLVLAFIFDTSFISMVVAHLGKYLIYAKPEGIDPIVLTQHNHSLWAGVSAFNLLVPSVDMARFTSGYPFCAGLLLLTILGIATFSKFELWQRTTLITSAVLLLPTISFDYTMVNWLIPVGMYLGANAKGRVDYVYATLFAIPLMPMAYYYIERDVSISVLIYPLAMILLLVMMVFNERRRI